MATLTIRDLDEGLKQRLRVRAAQRNRSMEEEARQILSVALAEPDVAGVEFTSRIRKRFAGLGDVVLPSVEREPVRQPPDWDIGLAPDRAQAMPPDRKVAQSKPKHTKASGK